MNSSLILTHGKYVWPPHYVSHLSSKPTLLLLLAEYAVEWFLDESHQLAQSSEQVSESKAPASDSYSIDEEVNEHPVSADEYQENAEISPFLASLDIQDRKILVPNGVGAVLAIVVCIRVEEIATGGLREVTGVLHARRAGRWIEVACLGRFAFDGYTGQGGSEDASNPGNSQ